MGEKGKKRTSDSAAGTRAIARDSNVFQGWDWLYASALVIAVFLVYAPAWQGGPVWDDDAHITRLELRSWDGLYRIWFDVRATTQYYPLVHTTFWIEHALWGDATLGYHLVNILLHATAAVLLAAILRRLAIPGAFLAAAIFALHPVQVESVAWITELKNTLSGVFYLLAALAYLRFDRSRATTWYVVALTLFLCALLTKTVTATLPGALLVIFWWQRGRLSWTKDVLPLVPFFVVGAGMGMITAWWELKVNGCVGPDFDLTWAERILIAGRAAWFHLGKLFWPLNLTFIYPRWQLDPSSWQQYMYPLSALVLLAVLWAIRRWMRAPLAAVLFFGGTLFPTLGFFNLYTFQYSFIADHYQYLACLGIITLFSSSVALLLQGAEDELKVLGQFGCGALLAALAVLSSRQSGDYADFPTLFRATLAKNPDSWMVHLNLGRALVRAGEFNDGIVELTKALEMKPNADSHFNLGVGLVRAKLDGEAMNHFRIAIDLKPDDVEAHNNLGAALARHNQLDEAITHFRKVLEIKPDDSVAHVNLGMIMAIRGHDEEALDHYKQALALAKARNDRAMIVAIWEQLKHIQPDSH